MGNPCAHRYVFFISVYTSVFTLKFKCSVSSSFSRFSRFKFVGICYSDIIFTNLSTCRAKTSTTARVTTAAGTDESVLITRAYMLNCSVIEGGTVPLVNTTRFINYKL